MGKGSKTRTGSPHEDTARYTEEYKQEALELWRKSGHCAAKVALARRLRKETTVSLRWIAENLHMGTRTHVSNRLYQCADLKSVNTWL